MKLFSLVILIFCGCYPICAQTPPDMKIFESADLKFSYPADWEVTDKSAYDLQEIRLNPKDKSVTILLFSPLISIESKAHLSSLRADTYEGILGNMRKGFAPSAKPVLEDPSCIDLNTRMIPGVRLEANINDVSATGEIYSFVFGKRLLNLMYVRSGRDSIRGDRAWNEVLRTLSLRNPKDSSWLTEKGLDVPDKGVVNQMATRLAKPVISDGGAYSVDETVRVNVVIDETGKVIKAEPPSTGSFNLKNASVQAARNSKFKPLLVCGKPVKYSGTIIFGYQPLPF